MEGMYGVRERHLSTVKYVFIDSIVCIAVDWKEMNCLMRCECEVEARICATNMADKCVY